MNRAVLLIAILFAGVSCDSVTVGSSESEAFYRGRGVQVDLNEYDWLNGIHIADSDDFRMPEATRARYRHNAIVLALRVVVDSVASESFDGPTPYRLPQPLIEYYYDVLVHFYNSRVEARDSVVHFYKADYAAGGYAWDSFGIGLNDSVEFELDWTNSVLRTENPVLDSMILEYDLILDGFWPLSNSIYFRTPHPAYLAPLEDTFSGFPEVRWAGPDGYGISINDIEISHSDSVALVTYSHGWGDCPAGCIYRHYWDFKISPSGEVEYAGNRGEPLLN